MESLISDLFFELLLPCQVEEASIHYRNLSLSSACEAVLEIGNAGNAYMDERAPWSLFKQGGAAAEDASKVHLFCISTR